MCGLCSHAGTWHPRPFSGPQIQMGKRHYCFYGGGDDDDYGSGVVTIMILSDNDKILGIFIRRNSDHCLVLSVCQSVNARCEFC